MPQTKAVSLVGRPPKFLRTAHLRRGVHLGPTVPPSLTHTGQCYAAQMASLGFRRKNPVIAIQLKADTLSKLCVGDRAGDPACGGVD